MADPDVLSDEELRPMLELESRSKKGLTLVAVGESMYKRESDGNWYRLGNARDINPPH